MLSSEIVQQQASKSHKTICARDQGGVICLLGVALRSDNWFHFVTGAVINTEVAGSQATIQDEAEERKISVMEGMDSPSQESIDPMRIRVTLLVTRVRGIRTPARTKRTQLSYSGYRACRVP